MTSKSYNVRIPDRLILQTEVIATEYTAGDSFQKLAKRYGTSTSIIGAILTMEGVQIRGRGGDWTKRMPKVKAEKIIIRCKEVDRKPCSRGISLEGVPVMCVLTDLGQCDACIEQRRDLMDIGASSSWTTETLGGR